MKKTYTKKQITEAIKYWTKVLRESEEENVTSEWMALIDDWFNDKVKLDYSEFCPIRFKRGGIIRKLLTRLSRVIPVEIGSNEYRDIVLIFLDDLECDAALQSKKMTYDEFENIFTEWLYDRIDEFGLYPDDERDEPYGSDEDEDEFWTDDAEGRHRIPTKMVELASVK